MSDIEAERDNLLDEIDAAWAALGVDAEGDNLAAAIEMLKRERDLNAARAGYFMNRASRAEAVLYDFSARAERVTRWAANDD